MVRLLDSTFSSQGLSPGRGHCVVYLGKTLNSHCVSLHSSVHMDTSKLFNARGVLVHVPPIQDGVHFQTKKQVIALSLLISPDFCGTHLHNRSTQCTSLPWLMTPYGDVAGPQGRGLQPPPTPYPPKKIQWTWGGAQPSLMYRCRKYC